MKKLLACFVCPVLAATGLAFLLLRYSVLPVLSFSIPSAPPEKAPGMYIDKFDNDAEREALLFEENEPPTISIFGSSELSHAGPAAPQNFIPLVSPFQVRSFGHAGNQCLSILCQLLAKEQSGHGQKIVIILSPGWFESKAALGTTSTVFLEYNSENMLQQWLDNESEEAQYARKRIAEFFSEFSSPGNALRSHFLKYQANLSPLHYPANAPLLQSNRLLGSLTKMQSPPLDEAKFKHELNRPPSVTANWDSLFSASKAETRLNSGNNSFGINNDYFSGYIGNKRGKIQPVPEALHTELKDFRYLLKYISRKKLNVCFVISPLNALYYRNLESLDPVMSLIEKEIQQAEIPLFNLFTSETKKYEKEILSDVMHLSDYGWYKTNQFIIENFSKK